MEITAQMVKNLRDMTGAGMMDCKKALVSTNGNLEEAVDFLRKSGIAKAGKRAGNSTNEGTTCIVEKDGYAVCIEVLCETDFVAINDKFKETVKSFATKALDYSNEGEFAVEFSTKEEDSIKSAIAIIQENIQIRRLVRWKTSGTFGAYLHQGGKIGVLVDIAGEVSAEDAKAAAMHIAAFSPIFVSAEEISTEAIAHEKDVFINSDEVQAKPENIRAGIVEGKLKKWKAEVCFVDQSWIYDDKSTFAKLFPKAKVIRFVRWQAGENI